MTRAGATLLLLVLASVATACTPSTPPPVAFPSAALPASLVQPTPADNARTLPLQGVHNGRDFGGIAGEHAPIPTNRFFRAASLSAATEGDKALLLEHGVRLDIDLRTIWEVILSPDALAHDPRFHYLHISLMGSGIYDALYPSDERGALYVHALRHHQSAFRDVFRALAAEREGAVLVHCASGKDRTGLVSAILLSLAGVPREEIVHDYAISAQYLRPVPLALEAENAARESPPAAIDEFLRVLEKEYGGARAYLKRIGVSDEDVRALVGRLGQ